QLDVAADREDEVVREGLVVVEEVLLDRLRVVTQAEDEVVVPVVGVVAHDVPQDGAVPYRDHRLRNRRPCLANAQPLSAAEEDDLHETTWTVGMGTTSSAPHSRVYSSC